MLDIKKQNKKSRDTIPSPGEKKEFFVLKNTLLRGTGTIS
jgi:hypothetical protein